MPNVQANYLITAVWYKELMIAIVNNRLDQCLGTTGGVHKIS